MGLNKTTKASAIKGINQQNERATYRVGEMYLQIVYLIRG